MKTFFVERDIPGADKLTAEELKSISAKSNDVVAGMGLPYKWLTSYVAGDKLYCIHQAENVEDIYRHARKGGFPANAVTEIAAVIGPETATGK
jgi:Protein of unknown function (DUF4242)